MSKLFKHLEEKLNDLMFPIIIPLMDIIEVVKKMNEPQQVLLNKWKEMDCPDGSRNHTYHKYSIGCSNLALKAF